MKSIPHSLAKCKQLIISEFPSIRDVRPKHREASWADIERECRFPKVRKTKGGPLWSGAEYNGTRNNANVVKVHVVMADLDDSDLESIYSGFDSLGCSYLLHSTYSFAPGNPRFRVIVPLADPIPARHYADLLDKLQAKTGLVFDTFARDACRISYKPIVSSRNALYCFDPINRVALDWRELEIGVKPRLQKTNDELNEALFEQIAYRCRVDECCFESQRNLAKAMSVDRNRIKPAIETLLSQGRIFRREADNRGRPNPRHFYFLDKEAALSFDPEPLTRMYSRSRVPVGTITNIRRNLNEGERYSEIFRSYRGLRFSMDAKKLERRVREDNQKFCSPPLREDRVSRLITDILKGRNRSGWKAGAPKRRKAEYEA